MKYAQTEQFAKNTLKNNLHSNGIYKLYERYTVNFLIIHKLIYFVITLQNFDQIW